MKTTLFGFSLVLLVGIVLIVLALLGFLVSVILRKKLEKKAQNQIAGALALGILFITISLITGQ
jgi:heme/copper-type cytochrome/quinol oxidase subunit 2